MPYQFFYLDYIDKATGKTLVVTPGSAYTIALASGRNTAAPAYPNDGRWSNASTFNNLSMELPADEEPAAVKKVPDKDAGAAKAATETESKKEGA